MATKEKVANIDGLDLSGTIENNDETRPYLHGEHFLGEASNQYIVTKDWKYIWHSTTGEEQLFDLLHDPYEEKDLGKITAYQTQKEELKQLLITELMNREEGFVKEGQLVVLPVSQLKTILD